MPGTALGGRLLHAGFWGMALVVALRVFSVARVVVIARILSPGAFGLFGVAAIVTSFQETVLQRLMFSALIRRKGDIESYLDAVWTVRLIANAIPVAVLFALSGLIADLLNAPGAVMIIRVMLLVVLVRSLSNIGVVYFEKNLEFQKRFAYELSFFAVEAVVGVALLLVMRDVWALVYGALAGSVFQVAISYILQPRRPRLRVDWAGTVELFRFDRWVLSSLSLVYLVNHVDQIVIGRLVGVAPLGLFRMAGQLSRNATVELGTVITKAAFPAFSLIEGDRGRLRRGFLQAHQWGLLFVLPVITGAVVLADEFTYVVLGEQWMPMVPAFRLMMLAGLISVMSQVANSLFMGVGRPNIATGLLLVRLLIIGILIVPLTLRWGVSGAAAGVLISQIVVYPISAHRAISLAGADIAGYLRTFITPVSAAAIMTLALIGLRDATTVSSSISAFLFAVSFGAVIYLAALFVIDRFTGSEISGALRQRIGSQFGTAGR